jgi:uncharacterized protein
MMERRPALQDRCASPGDYTFARAMAESLKKLAPDPGSIVRWRCDLPGGPQYSIRQRTVEDILLDHQDADIAARLARQAHQRNDPYSALITGHAIVVNSLSENIGGFKERIKPGALHRTLEERIDVRALLDHDPARRMGRVTAGTLRLAIDARGLRFTIDPPPTSYARDAIASIRRGDLTGASFGFTTISDDWFMGTDGVPIRHVLDLRCHETSLVTFPAYLATTVTLGERALPSGRPRRQWSGTADPRVSAQQNRLRQRLQEVMR